MNRERRAIEALLDLYGQAVSELIKTIEDIADNALTVVINPEAKDENCSSIQAILAHVVSCGYGYAVSIHNQQEHTMQRPEKVLRTTIRAYKEDLEAVLIFTADVFRELTDTALETANPSKKIKTSWGQLYDIEQMMEHAIVHILRHKRQLEQVKKQNASDKK